MGCTRLCGEFVDKVARPLRSLIACDLADMLGAQKKDEENKKICSACLLGVLWRFCKADSSGEILIGRTRKLRVGIVLC